MASQEIDDIVNNTRLELQEKSERNKILEEENASLKIKLKEYKDNIKLLEDEIHSLKQSNDSLEAEASKYQSALGIATNFDYSDDQNHSVKFSEDVLSLHDTLENYVTPLRPKIDVNLDEVKKLLPKYNCQIKISDEEPNKPFIKAVLQRHVLEEILVQADSYFKRSDKEYLLESDIMEKTTILTGLMERLYNNRPGDDEITRLIPIRLRQQVYTALGTRGFNGIKESINKYFKHNFIDTVSKEINKMMNKYRVIKDVKKKKYVEALAEELVINVVRIFYFRLRIQEPIAQYRWFCNNEKINKIYMKGSWDEDEVEDMVVEVCSFPLIFKPSPDGFKVCTPAKVFPRHFIEENIIDTLGVIKKMILSNDDSAPTLQIHENDFERTGSTDTHASIDA